MASPEVQAAIDKEMQEARAADVTGTPIDLRERQAAAAAEPRRLQGRRSTRSLQNEG